MQQHVGDEFDGVITSVKHFGLFIMLNDFFVEGLVHVTSLGNDYYHAEHGGLRLTGEHTGNSYGLGDQVRVRISRVDVEEARVDLQMVDDASQAAAPSKHRGKGGRKSADRKSADNKHSSSKKSGKKRSDKKRSGKKKSGNKQSGSDNKKTPAKAGANNKNNSKYKGKKRRSKD
jgi:ribonuclease R